MGKKFLKIHCVATLFFFVTSLLQPLILAAQTKPVTSTPTAVAPVVKPPVRPLAKVQDFSSRGNTAIMTKNGNVGSIKSTTGKQLTLDFNGREAKFSVQQQKAILTGKPVTQVPAAQPKTGIFNKIRSWGQKLMPKVNTTIGMEAGGQQPTSLYRRAINNLKNTFNQPKWVPDPNNPGKILRVPRDPAALKQFGKQVEQIAVKRGETVLKKFSTSASKNVNSVTKDVKTNLAGKQNAPAVNNAKSAARVVGQKGNNIANDTANNLKTESGKAASDVGKLAQKTIGKGLTNIRSNAGFYARAGVENVKMSLKSGFSAQNLLVMAGITTTMTLAQQIMKGGKPDLMSAAKVLISGHFIGGMAGAVMGGAAGSFFVPALSAIPMIGGVLGALAPAFGAVAGSMFGSDLLGERKSFGEALRSIDWFLAAGQGAGAVIGSSLGAVLGPFGMIAGGIIGSFVGAKISQMVKSLFGKGKGLNSSQQQLLNLSQGNDQPYSGSAGDVSEGVSADQIEEGYSPNVTNLTEQKKPVSKNYHEQITRLKLQYKDLISRGKNDSAARVLLMINDIHTEYEKSGAGGN
ncbi:hypothetical protein ACFL35_10930 [Candidatus Riflebacteria bacterium]